MFDDLFEIFGNQHKRRYGQGHDHGHEQDHDHGNYDNVYGNNPENRNVNQYPNDQRYQHRYNKDIFDPRVIMAKVLQNKQLLIILAVAAVIIVIGIVAVSIMLMPLLYKLFVMFEKNGIKGIIDSLLPFANRIWEGSQTFKGR
jgi:hypothetical protein